MVPSIELHLAHMVMRSGYLASGTIVDPQSADKEEYHAAEYTYYYASTIRSPG